MLIVSAVKICKQYLQTASPLPGICCCRPPGLQPQIKIPGATIGSQFDGKS